MRAFHRGCAGAIVSPDHRFHRAAPVVSLRRTCARAALPRSARPDRLVRGAPDGAGRRRTGIREEPARPRARVARSRRRRTGGRGRLRRRLPDPVPALHRSARDARPDASRRPRRGRGRPACDRARADPPGARPAGRRDCGRGERSRHRAPPHPHRHRRAAARRRRDAPGRAGRRGSPLGGRGDAAPPPPPRAARRCAAARRGHVPRHRGRGPERTRGHAGRPPSFGGRSSACGSTGSPRRRSTSSCAAWQAPRGRRSPTWSARSRG